MADVAHDNPLTTPPGVHYGPSVTQAIRPRSFLGGKTEGRLSEREVSNLALANLELVRLCNSESPTVKRNRRSVLSRKTTWCLKIAVNKII